MKIGVVGGGPAGLYFALLMKKADPSHDIAVGERNPPDATFGWGVVFSEEALTELRDADYETYVEIAERFVRWSALDIRYRGEVTRSYGHGFSAFSRKVLLDILQRRCAELGVELRFHQEVGDLGVFSDCDLIVGADGVRSTVRQLHADQFQPSLDVHDTKYAWFGTDLVFDAFTFIFRETPHGLFQVHAYPFDSETSTFIVECTEGTWRRAGLHEMSEVESMSFCEELFDDHLAGHKLLSNRSTWISFITLRNENWHYRNIALVGDAAHTAHFSIGSGTKLAMEDSVELTKALLAHPGYLEAAFAEYELERQPAVERLQMAARESATYFENVSRYMGFHPIQFAFNLLTRSGRITHLNLELRDPTIVGTVDRWFKAQASGDGQDLGRVVAAPPMLAPLRLGAVTLSNRVVLAPIAQDAAEDGTPGEVLVSQLREAAAAGPGLIVSETTAVSGEGRVTSGSAGIYREEHVRAWRSIVDRVHADGQTGIALRLGHSGPRGSTRPRRSGLDRPLRQGNWPLLAASPVAYTAHSQVPVAMDRAAMDRVRDDFAAAATRAAEAGFDMVILDFAHGYLMASFLSPLTNRRVDEFGGDLDGRLRYPLQVFDAVRGVWPSGRPLAVRFSVTDWVDSGLREKEAVAIAAALGRRGCDLIDVAAGHTVAEAKPEYRRLFTVQYSDRIRNEAGIPTMTGGHITTFDEVNTIVAAGRADLCVLDPYRYLSFERS
ncbi:MAG: FAD-dependent monooxygenase [Acidimicrobiia bacterium]